MRPQFDDILMSHPDLFPDFRVFSYFLLKLLINTILLSNLWVIHYPHTLHSPCRKTLENEYDNT